MLVWIVLLIFSVMIHEVSHGAAAYLLGDDTAKRAGRLSLNPFRHLDPVWTILLPALLYISSGGRFLFAMAKPVPVNFQRLHEPKKDMGIVGFAGPFSNVLLAALFSLFWKLNGHPVLLTGVYLNLGLAVFNMVPIPPLDGSRVAASLMPRRWASPYLRIERLGYLIILVLYFTGILMHLLIPAVDGLCRILEVPLLSATP